MKRNLQIITIPALRFALRFVTLCAGTYILLAILGWIAKEFLRPILQRLGEDTYEHLRNRFSSEG